MKTKIGSSPNHPLGRRPFAALLLALVCASATTIHAATILVNSSADAGPDTVLPDTLRAALASAADGDTIDAKGITGTITLMPGGLNFAELVVDKSVTILGPGPANLTVDANHLSRVFHIRPGLTVTIDGLSIINGVADTLSSPANLGAGIYNDHSTLLVNNCVLSGNSATFGGGIFNAGTSGSAMLTVNNSIVNANSAQFDGGGIYNDGELSGNATLEITASSVNLNSAGVRGGGIVNDGSNGTATAKISTSTVGGNSASKGGGIYNDHSALTVNNCTLSGNSVSDSGGGIYNNGVGGDATVEISVSTLSGNSTDDQGEGGGIFNDGESGSAIVKISASTLSGNSARKGGGIMNIEATLEIGNTILKAGSPGENVKDSVVISHGFNLSSDAAGGDASTGPGGFLNATGDQRNTDPKLGPLADNGGPTRTHLPMAGSPAIDQGLSNTIGPLATDTDQRGLPRTFQDPGTANAPFGDGTDIGAVELQVQELPAPNKPPVAKCKDVTAVAGPGGTASASIDDGSFDPDSGDTISFLQFPPGPYAIGTTPVTLTVMDNHGNSSNCSATVTVVAPNHPPVAKCKNVTVLAGPNGTATASIDDGSFDPDSGDSITILPTPPGPYPIGTTSVTLTVTDSHNDSSSCTATVTVQGVADLAISKAVASGQAKPGQVLTYTLIVTNRGPNPASGVVVNDAVPQGTAFASASPAPASAPPAGGAGTVTWNPGSLSSGASATLTLTVKVSVKGNALIVNTATVTSSSSDPNPANNSVTVTSKRQAK